MARSEARLLVDIWNDPDWLSLSPDAQRAYMFLVSQHDLAHDGVIALRVRRWAQKARGLDVKVLGEALRELEAGRFVVIDRDCEELLIRSFMRRDKVYKQPNVLRAAADHLPLVASHAIRMALAVELMRIEDEPMPEASSVLVKAMLDALPNPSGNPSPNPSGKADPDQQRIDRNPSPGTPGERGVVTVVSSASPIPVPRDPRTPDPPQPLATLASAAPGSPQTVNQRARRITDAHSDAEPMSNWAAIRGIVVKAIKAGRWSDDEIRDALLRMAGDGRPVTVDSLRIELDGLPARSRASPRASTTDERVNGALRLAEQLERLEIES